MYLPYSAIQHLRREKTTILPTKILTVILLGTLTACASGQYRKKTLVKILDQQETVIESLKTERSESEIAQKLKKDPKLSRAEEHLMNALNALKASSDLLKTEIQNN